MPTIFCAGALFTVANLKNEGIITGFTKRKRIKITEHSSKRNLLIFRQMLVSEKNDFSLQQCISDEGD